MEQKIQLKHPAGKKAVSMEKGKYEVLKKTIMKILKEKGGFTHKELLKAVTEDFKKDKIKFVGSVEWYMEWVKLDLEARMEIKRIGDKAPLKFSIT